MMAQPQTKMKIALDFDGVLSHTMKSWVKNYNKGYSKKYNKQISVRDIDKWAFYESWGMEKEECFDIFDQCWQDWEKLEPLEQDLWQKTKMLCNLGEVDIVTSVSERWLPEIECWLQCQGIHYNKLIHSDTKSDLDYDVYIDDSQMNIERVVGAGKIALMLNQPWNREVLTTDKIIRVYNLYHAIDVIRELQGNESKK